MEIEEQDSRLLSDKQKWTILIAIKHFEMTYRAIKDKFGFASIGTLSKIWQKYDLTGTIHNNYDQCGGHNSKDIEEEEVKYSIETINLVKYSSGDVQTHLKQDQNIELSQSSIVRIFQKFIMKYDRIIEIHELSEDNKYQRVMYCEKNQKYYLKNYLFSDESILSLSQSNSSVWFSANQSNQVPTKQIQYKDNQIHVWGAISWDSKSQLQNSSSVNSLQNQLCLISVLVPWKKKQYMNKKWFLLQDGAKPHTSKSSQQYFQDNGIQIKQKPPWSPDLNTIEHVWAYMKKQFVKTRLNVHIMNRQQLIQIVTEIWNNIPQQVIQNMIAHTQHKMKEIIKVKGYYLS